VNWIQLAEYRVHLWAVLNVVMNLIVLCKSGSTLHYVVSE
jgi:hypothetical protein